VQEEIVTRTFDHNRALMLGTLVAILFLFQTVNAVQLPESDLQKMLGSRTWTTEELTALENGQVVVRPILTADKQEIASMGVLRMRNLPQVSMIEFRGSLSQKGSDAKRAGGRFSDPPTIEDLGALELEKETIEQLQKCSIGSCDLNLSAEAITRIQREIDWSSENADAVATQLFRDMLLAYVQGYLARGDGALGEYDNRRRSVDLAASHRTLLSTSSLVKGLAPEFIEYLQKFPRGTLENVETGMQWYVVDFGLKPSITVSHTAAYTQPNGDHEQLFVSSKQIYSSRYLDSSLTFTLLLRVTTNTGADTYLVFIDRSRSDALDGPLGGLARKLVQNEVTERIKNLLARAELKLLAVGKPEDRENDVSDEAARSWTDTFTRSPVTVIFGAVLGAFMIFVLWRWSRQR
jgi:hypothetical protein